jgi:hypothetical protein
MGASTMYDLYVISAWATGLCAACALIKGLEW